MTRLVNERNDVLAALREVFREYGYAGTSLALIGKRSGLGKGSLYHFFPGGKEEMAAAVLDDIGAWFEQRMFQPLREDKDPVSAIRGMFRTADEYFQSGERICLVGAFALSDVRDSFAARIDAYFVAWRNALANALNRAGKNPRRARTLAEDVICAIQGAVVSARAHNDSLIFNRLLKLCEKRLEL